MPPVRSRNRDREFTILKRRRQDASAGLIATIALAALLAAGAIYWAVSEPRPMTAGYEQQEPTTTGQGGSR